MVEIMEANHHYYTPEVDGVAAITNQLTMSNNVMLVAEVDRTIVGFVIGTWDGARAFLFKLSVHPDFQGRGIGSELVRESARRFKKMGAVTLGLAAADGSTGEANNAIPFWERLGFEKIPARLMIHFEINDLVIE
jgi:ribosomal protein S18 acetylase RimI-like enzyme